MKARFFLQLTALLFAMGLSGPVRADAIDPASLQLARQLMDVMHVSSTSDQMLKQMVGAMATGVNAANPGKAQEIQELLTEAVMPEMNKLKPDLIDASAHIYAANFSADDLKQMLAYYQSGVGQKVIQRLPTILQEQGRIGQQLVMKMIPEIQENVEKALAAHGLKKPI